MKNICIVGWYGTETLGDRAIFDGILMLLKQSFGQFNVFLGSLYPFYTERSLYEDGIIYQKSSGNMKISIFDEKTPKERKKNIAQSDLVLMGGGPLMDLDELYIILDSFIVAKKMHKKTALIGCGFGPLFRKGYLDCVLSILNYSDLIIFRDLYSKQQASLHYQGKKTLYNLYDPAIFSIAEFKNEQQNESRQDDVAVLNFREFPSCVYGSEYFLEPERIIHKLASRFNRVLLVPMHTFFIGGDDREYLEKISKLVGANNVEIMFSPPNLHQLYSTFYSAKACVGMRYHSVVMQTILNGNNVILNYTDPELGKIPGFVNTANGKEFYAERTLNMLNANSGIIVDDLIDTLGKNECFMFNYRDYDMKQYCKLLNELFHERE